MAETSRGESRVFLWARCKPMRVCGLGEEGEEEGGREREEKGERERMTQRELCGPEKDSAPYFSVALMEQ